MRLALALSVVLAAVGCDSKDARTPPATMAPASAQAARPALVDLAGSAALAPVRTAFNAHKGELRFLTLLSPT
jgi:hypothetical protein